MIDHNIYLKKNKKRAIDEVLLSSELFEFNRTIYNYHNKYYKIFHSISFIPSFLKSKEMPIIEVSQISFNKDIETELYMGLKEIVSIIDNYQRGIDLSNLFDSIQKKVYSLFDYIQALLNRDIHTLTKIAQHYNIETNHLIFIILNWIKPLFVYLFDKFNDRIDNDKWHQPLCPFCGYYPSMSKIVEIVDNKRFLHCSLCENEWQYERLSCTICCTKELKNLGYFTTKKDSPFRIDYCDNCTGYIKTIRIPKSDDADNYDLTVENILTPHLDLLAMERGYSRP